MINILVADDEFFVRAGLVSMLQELYPGKLSVVEVEDGLQLIEKLHSYCPDIVLLDIKMPRMNGLEAFSQAKILAPDAQWVILSGYADFSYAQQALKLGACDYVLKPISMENLEKLTNDAIKQRRKTLQDKGRTFASEIALMLNDKKAAKDSPETDYLRHYFFSGCVMRYDTSLTGNEKSENLQEHVSRLKNYCDEASTFFISHTLVSLPNGGLALVSGYSAKNNAAAQEKLKKFYSELPMKMRLEGELSSRMTGLLTKSSNSASELQDAMEELSILSPARILLMQKPLLHYAELKQVAKDEWVYRLCEMIDQFCTAYSEQNYYQFSIEKERITTLIENKSLKFSLSMERHFLEFLQLYFGNIICKYVHPFSKIQWRKLTDDCEEKILLVGRQDRQEKPDIVKQVLLYVENHYDKNIGVSSVAEHFNITPNYLSTLFHNATGETFIKYLTNMRVFKAKDLLNRTDLPVYEVASHVGYENAKHFAKVFKKYTGCYPSKFRDNLL